MSSLPPGSLVLLDEWSTQYTFFNVFLFIRLSLTYFLLLKSSFAQTPYNYSVCTARTRSVSHSFQNCLTHACNLPCLAIASSLNHSLFRNSSTVTYPLYTPCPFLVVMNLHSSLHTLMHCVLFSRTESTHTILPSLKKRNSFPLTLWHAFILSYSLIHHPRLTPKYQLTLPQTYSPSTLHPHSFTSSPIFVNSHAHTNWNSLCLSHSHACTTISLIHYFPLPAQLVHPFCWPTLICCHLISRLLTHSPQSNRFFFWISKANPGLR